MVSYILGSQATLDGNAELRAGTARLGLEGPVMRTVCNRVLKPQEHTQFIVYNLILYASLPDNGSKSRVVRA